MVNKKKISTQQETIIKNEINLLMKIDHPHVVKIFEFFETKGYIHIVMEYVSGIELIDIWKNSKNPPRRDSKKSLSRKESKKNLSGKNSKNTLSRKNSKNTLSKKESKKNLFREGSKKNLSRRESKKIISRRNSKNSLLNENEEIMTYNLKSKQQMVILKKIFKQIFLAINYLHGIGIVHRDLKGENILWDGKNIKILDFGCSSNFKDNEKLTEKIGTPLYVSPEVIEGYYNEKCDIWSIGILFYILLVEKKPFMAVGKGKDAIFRQIKDLNFIISIEDLKCNQEVKDFLSLMLEKNVEKRISAEEILKIDFFSKEEEEENKEENFKNLDKVFLEEEYKKENFGDVGRFYSNMIEFYSYGEIKKSILFNIIREFVKDKNTCDIINIFKSFNKKNDGFLTKNEIKNGFKNLREFDKKDFDKININQFDKINFSRFLAAIINKNEFLKEEIFLIIAKLNDRDNNNGVDYIKYFKSLKNNKLIKGDYNMILKKVGVKKGNNHDHIISYELFAKFLEKVLR